MKNSIPLYYNVVSCGPIDALIFHKTQFIEVFTKYSNYTLCVTAGQELKDIEYMEIRKELDHYKIKFLNGNYGILTLMK